MKKILPALMMLLANVTPVYATMPASIDFDMPSEYQLGDTVNVTITNRTHNTITIPESGNCHHFFSIYDSNNQPIALSAPNQVCTQDFQTITLAPLESRSLGTWNQQYYVLCPPLAMCLVSSLPVLEGTYTVRVLVENQPYIEHTIYLSRSHTSFSDVASTHWAYQYIQNLYAKNIVQGYGNGTFGPENGITRAEVLKMALKSADFKNITNSLSSSPLCDVRKQNPSPTADYEPTCSHPLPYLDVSPRHALYPYIYQAYTAGIIKPSTYFYPDQKASRIECLQYIVDAFGKTPSPLPMSAPQTFSDVSAPSERAYTDSAAAAGIVSGNQGKFYPDQSVTRAEISKILSNMLTTN